MIYHLTWRVPEPNQDLLAQLRVRVPATRDLQGRALPRPLVVFNVMLRENAPNHYTIFFHHPPALDPRVQTFIRHDNNLFLLFKIRLTTRQERLQEDQHGRVHQTQRHLQPVPLALGVRYGVLQRPRWDQPTPRQRLQRPLGSRAQRRFQEARDLDWQV